MEPFYNNHWFWFWAATVCLWIMAEMEKPRMNNLRRLLRRPDMPLLVLGVGVVAMGLLIVALSPHNHMFRVFGCAVAGLGILEVIAWRKWASRS